MEVRVAAAMLPHSSCRVLAGAAAFALLAISMAAWGQVGEVDVGRDAFSWLRLMMFCSVALGVLAGAAAFVGMRNSFISHALLGGICVAMLVSLLSFWAARSLLITAEADKCAVAVLKTAQPKPYHKECRAAREMATNALGFGWAGRKLLSIGPTEPLDAGTARWLSYLSVLVWPAILLFALRPLLVKRLVPL